MATYRNKKTGATITTDLIISGGDWEIEEKKKKEPKKNANKDNQRSKNEKWYKKF